ncbi:MAG: hypothetical protein BroJett015_33770 [Chloroflexota bacterium]|nr:MAG: hypothetical protein BroJett015_33770 [Chloroflexota bacterium]
MVQAFFAVYVAGATAFSTEVLLLAAPVLESLLVAASLLLSATLFAVPSLLLLAAFVDPFRLSVT